MEGRVGKGQSARSRVARRRGHRPSWRTVVLATCLVVGAGLPVRDARAIIPVTDYSAALQRSLALSSTLSHYGSTIAHYGAVVKQYAADAAYYKSVIDHHLQQIVKLRGLANVDLAGIVMPPPLAEITATETLEHIEQACPGSKGKAGIGKLVSMFTPSLGASIRSQQQTLCVQIAKARVEKFNTTVRMIDRLRVFRENADGLAATLKQLGGSQGEMAGFKGVVEANQGMLEVEMQGWKAQIQANDQAISYFEHQQGTLGRVALRGDPSFLGTVVHASALRVAFEALNR